MKSIGEGQCNGVRLIGAASELAPNRIFRFQHHAPRAVVAAREARQVRGLADNDADSAGFLPLLLDRSPKVALGAVEDQRNKLAAFRAELERVLAKIWEVLQQATPVRLVGQPGGHLALQNAVGIVIVLRST